MEIAAQMWCDDRTEGLEMAAPSLVEVIAEHLDEQMAQIEHLDKERLLFKRNAIHANQEVERLREAHEHEEQMAVDNKARLRDANAEIKRLKEIVQEVGCSGVEYVGVSYACIQINPEVWEECREEAKRGK
jgi:hypothetical protein